MSTRICSAMRASETSPPSWPRSLAITWKRTGTVTGAKAAAVVPEPGLPLADVRAALAAFNAPASGSW